ncbi:MAG: DnaJ C-terminal domain-containing protein [Phycisphaerales bacterium]
MARQRDYYEILGVKRTASADEIRKAYRALARKLHPDVNKADDASEQFGELQQAYDVLADEKKRASYDRFGHAGGAAAATGGGGSSHPGSGPHTRSYTWDTAQSAGINVDDVASIFEQVMGGRGGGGFGSHASRAQQRPMPRKGEDLRHKLAITFLTAAKGGTESVRIASADGSTQTVDVRIPAGIESGGRLRIKGKGQPSQTGGSPGDLILTINVGPHPWLKREGDNLLIELPISIAEAINGAEVEVPLLSGSANVRIPPGTASGKRLRIKGQGIVPEKRPAGDLFVVVQVIPPDPDVLEPEEREVINRIAQRAGSPRKGPPWR